MSDMDRSPPALFDAHLHPETLSEADLASLRLFGVRRALVLGHHFAERTAASLRAHFEGLLETQLPRLARAGIEGVVALGVHPRCIPRRGLGEVLAALPDLFSSAGRKVVAVGEIGLHRGGETEEEAFVEQLGLATRLRTRVVVHTPGVDKERLTRRALALVRAHGPAASRVLVDHASPRTLPLILGCGHWAGLTVQTGELKAERVVALVRRLGGARLVLNSDAGDRPGDLLGMARAAHLLARAGLSPAVVEQVSYDNARAFLGLRN